MKPSPALRGRVIEDRIGKDKGNGGRTAATVRVLGQQVGRVPTIRVTTVRVGGTNRIDIENPTPDNTSKIAGVTGSHFSLTELLTEQGAERGRAG